ncbi:tetratricopeptide repeat family protein [Lysobacter antibioticus]|uniref:serine/threonine-protein kinase n=1 Tax=Lysobacter antibioticus TaxID=84531 RepID=UPI00071724AE|nr:serine/threonine-protein kinase [Lysobacter antibioticus]ALN64680.1 tetratricopeptide repeat family protein [Lysobacter antibioticus]
MTLDESSLERRALQLFRGVLDASSAERERLLGQACAGDEALQARVRALLAQVEESEAGVDPGTSLPQGDATGLRIGPYRLLERIGRGGMGEVFRAARCDGAYEREVALKRIWSGFAPLGASPLTERFLRERQALARLQHTGIAQLYDGGVTETGQPWFAMELVRGEPITRWCAARAATIEQRVELVQQVCAAIDFAHRALIVHRDLKPANVLVDEAGQAKLLDFGIAKWLDDADAEQTQALAMTPAWAAPEQREGRAVTTATDVYQLGMLLRVLLSDDLPALGQASPRLASAYEALRKRDASAAQRVAHERATTPERLLARLRGDLDCIVAQATAQAPQQRYRSAAALADDLQRWLEKRPVHARGEDRAYRWRRAAQRHWPALTTAAAALVLASGMAFYHFARLGDELQRTRVARDEATAAQTKAEAQRGQAEATAEYFVDLFKQARPRETTSGEVSARALMAASLEELLADRKRDPLVRASLLAANGRAASYLGRDADAERAAGAAIALWQAHPQADQETLAKTRLLRAGYLHHLQRPEEAQRELDQAVALAARIAPRDPDLRTSLQLWRANLAGEREDAATIRDAYEQVLRLTEHSLQRRLACRSHYAGLGNLAMLDIDEGRPADAERRLRRALAMIGPCGISDHADGLILRRVLAVALIDQARLGEARTLMAAALEESRAHFGATDSFLAHALFVQALLEVIERRPAAAQKLLAEVARIDDVMLPPSSPMRYSRTGLGALSLIAQADHLAADKSAIDTALRGAVKALRPIVQADGSALRSGSLNERASGHFHALALAYAQCRLDSSSGNREAFVVARAAAGAMRPWRTRISRDWGQRCGV